MTNPLATTPQKLSPSQITFWNDVAFDKKETHLQTYRLLKNKFPKFHWLWITIKNFPDLMQSSVLDIPLTLKKKRGRERCFPSFSPERDNPAKKSFHEKILKYFKKSKQRKNTDSISSRNYATAPQQILSRL